MKTTTLTALLFLSIVCNAQLRLAPTGDFKIAIQKVVADYLIGFPTLKADMINSTPQTVEYATTLKLAAAEENSITQYSGSPEVYSWSATVLTTEFYKDAAKKYAAVYNEIKRLPIVYNEEIYTLTGTFEDPSPDRKFAMTTFTLDPKLEQKNFRMQLTMKYDFPEWKVQLLLFEKEREDTDGPTPRQTIKKKPL